MPDFEKSPEAGGEAYALRRVLERIASTLDCPISDFFAVDSSTALGNLGELVRLWHAIPEGPGRARVLSAARQQAAGSEGSDTLA